MKKKILFVILMLVSTTAYAVPVSSGLVLQLDGSNVTAAESDGQMLVSSWNDQAGTSDNFIQTLSTEMPKLITGGLNGYNTISFDGVSGSDDILQLEDVAATALNPDTGGFTVFIVAKINSNTSGNYLFRKGNYASAADEGWSIFTDGTRILSRIDAGNINDTAHKAGIQSSMTEIWGEWFVYSFVLDGSLMTGYLNGNSGTGYADGVYTGSISPEDSAFLGVNTNGEMAEVLVYNRALSSTEQNTVGYYLENKYDLDTVYVPEPTTISLMSMGLIALLKGRKNI